MLNDFAFLSELAGGQYQLLLDSQELNAVLTSVKVPDAFDLIEDDITGLVVYADEGEYKEIWATDSSRPYLNSSRYTQLL